MITEPYKEILNHIGKCKRHTLCQVRMVLKGSWCVGLCHTRNCEIMDRVLRGYCK